MPITREVVTQPGNRKFKIVLDTKHKITDEELFDLILSLNKDALKMQEADPDRGGPQLQGVVNDGQVHFVFTADMLLLTDSAAFAKDIWRALRPKTN